MHRTDAPDNTSNLFQDGNPSTGQPGTKLEKDWLNAVQEEIAHFIEDAGITLVKGTNTQLVAALMARAAAAATASKLVLRDANGRAAFADPAAAQDAATKGWTEGKQFSRSNLPAVGQQITKDRQST